MSFTPYQFIRERNVILIEGSVACEKSSVCKELQKRGYSVFLEPNIRFDDESSLQKFYRGEETFQFQAYALMRNFQQFLKGAAHSFFFVERSVLSCFKIFGSLLRDLNKINKFEYDLLRMIYDVVNMQGMIERHVRQIFVLQCGIEEQQQRIKKRGKKQDETISNDYIQHLNDRYERYNFLTVRPVYKLNTTGKNIQQITHEMIALI